MRTNKTERKQKLKESKGITLIALVITIIVLLILAGVTIATLTGDNGILNQAGKAKDKTTEAESIERVQVEVAGSYGTDGKIDSEQLKKNLGNISGLTYDSGNFSLPATVSLNGYDILIDENGNVTKKVTVEEAKTNETVFGDNTTIYDAYENQIKIPAGFKIASDSATDVTGGIVIEDATYTNTLGSQFVWIPVGTGENAIKKSDGSLVEIALGRYVFDSSGNIDTTLSVSNPSDQLKTSSSSFYYTEGLKDETTTNTHSIDITSFITSANDNHGYYIGRYEARKSSGGNLTVVGTDSVYKSINQSGAATASRNMYNSDKFTSDLMNSYAWDTAIVFEQAFDNRTTDKKTKPYSKQNSLNKSLATTGTNNLTDTTKQDKICNIWDMASNCFEWTTESCSSSSYYGVLRGGDYAFSWTVSVRNTDNYNDTCDFQSNDHIFTYYSFRPLLYL